MMPIAAMTAIAEMTPAMAESKIRLGTRRLSEATAVAEHVIMKRQRELKEVEQVMAMETAVRNEAMRRSTQAGAHTKRRGKLKVVHKEADMKRPDKLKAVHKEANTKHQRNARTLLKEALTKLLPSVKAEPMKLLCNVKAEPTMHLYNVKAAPSVVQLTEVLPNPEAAHLPTVLLREAQTEDQEVAAAAQKEAAEDPDN